MRYLILAPLIASFAMGAVFAADPTPPKFEWTLKKPKDRIETKLAGDGVIFNLKSETGIGEGSVVLTAGAWPKRVVLRLLDFPALEGFSAEAGDVRLEASLGFPQDHSERAFDKAGHVTEQAGQAVFHVNIRRVDSKTVDPKSPDGKYIEVELPPNFLPVPGKPLSLHWIDAYRN